MSEKRVRIRPLRGGINTDTKNELCSTIYNEGIKFSRIIPTSDTFVVVCLSEEQVDKLIAETTVNKLKEKAFEVIVPPHLKARKTVFIRRLDKDLTALPTEILKQDIEHRNVWATVEEVVNFPNMPSMLKIRFSDIRMARKAIELGLSIGEYHLNSDNIEMEDFIQLTPCWACYRYDHSIKDCKEKNIKRCSECAAVGHTFRECKEKINLKCLNCDGPHRTLAAACPIRKEKIKEIREQRKANKKQFETENKTYCAVTKLSKDLPKLTVPEQPTLNLQSDMSFKAMVILIHAHLANIAQPGSFGTTVKNLLKKNNLPIVHLPDDAPSSEIFRIATNFPRDDIQVNIQEDSDSEGDTDVDIETQDELMEEEGGAVGYTLVDESLPPPPAPTHSQHTQPDSAPPPPPPSPRRQPGAHKSRSHRGSRNLGLELYSSSTDNIPANVNPTDLISVIKQGKVKYTYMADFMSESALLRYFAEGKLTTQKYPIQRVNRAAFKKIRNGIRRSPGDQERHRLRTTK